MQTSLCRKMNNLFASYTFLRSYIFPKCEMCSYRRFCGKNNEQKKAAFSSLCNNNAIVIFHGHKAKSISHAELFTRRDLDISLNVNVIFIKVLIPTKIRQFSLFCPKAAGKLTWFKFKSREMGKLFGFLW